MRILLILVCLLCTLPLHATGAEFCDGARFVPLDHVLSKPDAFLGKRVRTHAILRTDAKEYTRLSLDETSRVSILATADDESTAYNKQHDLSKTPPFDVVNDLFAKLYAAEGARYKPEMSKIRYYRQAVMACGRLIGPADDRRFALDDLHVERSYLLPWKH